MARLSTFLRTEDNAVGSGLTVYANLAAFPTTGPTTGDQAFNSDNNKIYVWNGNGWFSVATVNQTPTWTSEPDGSYALSTTGTATTITVEATDPDGFPITYGYTTSGLGNIATISQSGGTFTITPSTNQANEGSFTVTFTATDGVNQVVKPGISFTLQFKVDNSNYTSLLLKASGTGNNAVVPTDLSANSHTPTVTGDVYQTSFSPYRSGGYSLFFDGNGDYLTIPDSSDFNFATGNGDFTIECWIYKTNASESGWYTQRDTSTTELMIFLDHNISGYSAGQVSIEYDSSAYTFDAGIRQNVWQHIAFVRTGTTLKWFTDGVERDSRTEPASLADYAHEIYIGSWRSLSRYFEGYMYDFRIVNGTAVYTSAFDVPVTNYGAVTNTKLLLSGPGKFDNSDSKHTITKNGNVSTQPWTPYDYRGYEASTHGGSAYFVGSDDKLSYADNSDWDLSPGDWTIEFWLYKQDTGTYQNLFGQRNSSSNEFRVVTDFPSNDAGQLNFQYGSASNTFDADVQNNVWQHHAWVEHSGDVKVYIDGVLKYTNTNSVSVNYSAPFIIGGWSSSTYAFKGYMADFRLVNGTAVYTGNFTPPNGRLTTTGGSYQSTTNVNTSITAGHTKLLLPMVDRKIYDMSQTLYDGFVGGSAVASSGQTHFSENTIYIPNGDTDYNEIPANNTHLIYETDYTVEAWLYPTSFSSTNNNYFLSKGNPAASATNREWAFSITAGGLKAYWSTNGASSGDSAVSVSVTNNVNQWTHVAFTKYDNTIYIFKDGTFIGSGAFTSIYNAVNGATTVGRLFGYTGISHSYNGYIHDLRIAKGLSRYPYIATPVTLTQTNSGMEKPDGTFPTATASNTILLACHTSTPTTEGSSGGYTFTNNNSVAETTTAMPLGAPAGMTGMQFTASSSMYLENNNSEIPALSTGDWTIEYWVKPDTLSADQTHIAIDDFKPAILYDDSATKWSIYSNSAHHYIDTVTPEANKWYHFAWVHNDTDGKLRVFINGNFVKEFTENFNITSQRYRIGRDGAGKYMNGTISNMRVVKGQALYTNSFTPETTSLQG